MLLPTNLHRFTHWLWESYCSFIRSLIPSKTLRGSLCLGSWPGWAVNNLVPALDEFVIFRYIIFILLRKKLKLGPDDYPPLLTMAYSLVISFHICCLTYIVEGESCLVDPRAHKFVNPKLFHVFPYLILDPREDEVNLKRLQNRVCGLHSVTNQSLFTIITRMCRHISFLFCVCGSF